jgi:hypothetical protein
LPLWLQTKFPKKTFFDSFFLPWQIFSLWQQQNWKNKIKKVAKFFEKQISNFGNRKIGKKKKNPAGTGR